jgi:hypothetical protein
VNDRKRAFGSSSEAALSTKKQVPITLHDRRLLLGNWELSDSYLNELTRRASGNLESFISLHKEESRPPPSAGGEGVYYSCSYTSMMASGRRGRRGGGGGVAIADADAE